MLVVFIRECIILLLGIIVSLLLSLVGKHVVAWQGLINVFQLLVAPLLLCGVRLYLVKYPDGSVHINRRIGFQIALGFALISLLLFDLLFAIVTFVDAVGPAGQAGLHGRIIQSMWLSIYVFGFAYIFLYCVAHYLGFNQEKYFHDE